MRRRRWRWIGVASVVAFGLYLVMDVVLLQYLESRGAAEIARATSAEDATVDLGGFPFVPRFLGGRLTDISVRVRGATASGGLRIKSIEARMAEARFDAGDIWTVARSSFAVRTKVTMIKPVGIIELGEGDLEDYIRRSIPLVGDVKVKGSGVEVRFIKPGEELDDPDNPDEKLLTKPARFLPRVEGGHLVLSLTSISQLDPRFRADVRRIEGLIKLPKIPQGLSSSVSLRDGVIAVESQGAEVTMNVGQAGES